MYMLFIDLVDYEVKNILHFERERKHVFNEPTFKNVFLVPARSIVRVLVESRLHVKGREDVSDVSADF